MKNTLHIFIFTFLAVFSPISLFAVPLQAHRDTVVNYLVGTMDATTQPNPESEPVQVRMTTCIVQLEPSVRGSVLLYQEQALNNELLKPYRQRFLEITASEDKEIIESKSYRPNQPDSWSGFCSLHETERVITTDDLGESVCSVFLRPLATIYLGKTPPEGCPANVRGAVKITNTIILHSQGMETWDRGFDAQNNQVWGAKDQSYQFRKVKAR
ncbi:chromophore lyase CpcT/CpeT [Gloeocapsa sp. PCC 73106]|uniref:chromophore lyase CpcT/CpeT n=1 Tax=Gloeocapsa sp. PCC 73106 TaxID=102232 RepID=UPI0002AC7DC9|nr:chromophore lyase CpcT/CpeT [Gloeocapsa sp. PCC 73106]ELR97952.1 CpeT/CpcT family (DUF1001) [Gloeocapsa sp. PCC 73106]